MDPVPLPNAQPTSPKLFIPILLSILIVLLSSSTAYLGYQHILLTKQITELQKSQSLPAPSPIPDPTAGWKIYTNTKYGFSFKYPPTFFLSENTKYIQDAAIAINDHDFEIPVFDNDTYGKLPFFMSVLEKNNQISLQQASFINPIKNSFTTQTFQETSLEVGNRPATMFSGDLTPYFGGQNGDKHWTVVLEDSNKIYEINYQNFVTNKFDYQTFTQILSTFQFTARDNSNMDLAKQFASNYLQSQGHANPTITSINLLGTYTDKYIVSWNTGGPGGNILIIGNVNGKLAVPDEIMKCRWLDESGLDTNTLSYLGPTCQF